MEKLTDEELEQFDKLAGKSRYAIVCALNRTIAELRALRQTEARLRDENRRIAIKAEATISELWAAAKDAVEALENCYQVVDWPADGSTEQDRALAKLKAALAAPSAHVAAEQSIHPPPILLAGEVAKRETECKHEDVCVHFGICTGRNPACADSVLDHIAKLAAEQERGR